MENNLGTAINFSLDVQEFSKDLTHEDAITKALDENILDINVGACVDNKIVFNDGSTAEWVGNAFKIGEVEDA